MRGGSLIRDLRYAVRLFRSDASTTAVIVLTLSLGMGANSAMFGVANGLLRPLPVKAAGQIVVLAAQTPGDETGFQFQLSYRGLQDIGQRTDVFQDLFGAMLQIRGFSTGGKSTQFLYSAVSGGYFSALGVRAAAGRLFRPGEGESPGGPLLMVLGHSFWQKRFGGNPNVIGTQVRVDGQAVTIVGVTAKGFHGLYAGVDMDGYMTLGSMISLDAFGSDFFNTRAVRSLTVFGRLKPGVTVNGAQAAITVAARSMEHQYPESEKGVSIRVVPELSARPIPLRILSTLTPLVRFLPPVLGGVVLLLTTLNVGNILLARMAARQREMAIRSALGANRTRLIRHMLTETLLLAALGAVVGVMVGHWATQAFAASLDLAIDVPVLLDFSFDKRVFLYALLSTVCSGTLIGIWPALQVSRTGLNEALRDGARGSGGPQSQRIQELLVVAQIAGSLALLVCAGLFIRTLENAQRVDLGFEPSHLLNVRMNPKWAGYDKQRTEAFYRELMGRVKAWPETQAASLAFSTPLAYYMSGMKVFCDEQPLRPGKKPPEIGTNYVDASYFETMRIPMLRGRAFRDSDNERAPLVAIVNETMAKRFWPNQDPIGRHFQTGSMEAPITEVVGLARDSKYLAVFEQPLPYFYLPEAQHYEPWRVLQIRTSVAPETLAKRLEREISSLDPNMPMSDLQTMTRSLGGAQGFLIFRVGAIQASAMGILGLIVAVVGIYGVVSRAATQRTRETGIRMALGATPLAVVGTMVGRVLYLIVTGLAAGLAAAVAMARILKGFLIGVSGADPVTFVVIPFLLAMVAISATYIPAARAARSDPLLALRHE
ncbi:MAG: ABC transporter permease [Acidobacteriaceae bacterium]|nr:ABC transporter permease [Acidobacteriaceae bacterium]